MEQENLQPTYFEGAVPGAEQLTPEQVVDIRANSSAKEARDAETRRLQEETNRDNQIRSDRLREIREKLFGKGEAGILEGRYATTLSAETLQRAQKDIAVGERILQSKSSGVLTQGNVDRQTMPPPTGIEYAGTAGGQGLDLSRAEDNSDIYHPKPISDAEALRIRRRAALQRGQELHKEAELIQDVLMGVGDTAEQPARKPRLSDIHNAT